MTTANTSFIGVPSFSTAFSRDRAFEERSRVIAARIVQPTCPALPGARLAKADDERSGRDVYVYFNNDERGYAVANARRLTELNDEAMRPSSRGVARAS